MKAILLAAGRGSRLGPYTAERPKSLIPLGGKTLLQRCVENLRTAGFSQVVVVVGYRHEMIEETLAKNFPASFYKTLLNPDYTRGSGSSLMCAKDEIQGDIVIVESDLLYDHQILLRMASSEVVNAMAMGHFNHGRREVKIYLNGGNSIQGAAWSDPDDKKAAGDWVGFTKISAGVAEELRRMLNKTNPNQGKEIAYEDFIFALLGRFPFQAVYIQDIPWIEIDNEIDLKRAENEVCPMIDRKLLAVG